MRRVRVGVLWAFAALSASAAHAQGAPAGTWQATVDYLTVVTRGNDVHVGDVFTEHQTVSGPVAQSRLDYGVTFDPIATLMKNDQSFMAAVTHHGPEWSFGVRAWRATAGGSGSGSRNTAAPTATSQFVTGIRLWENSIIPVTNQQEPAGISPVTFHADNELKNVRIEGFAERAWVNQPRLTMAMRAGLAHSRIKNIRSEGQTQKAFIVETLAGTTSTLNNSISIDSQSETEMSLTGPMVGVSGSAGLGVVRLEWLLAQSVLFGTAETTGSWTDVDNINEVRVTGGVRSETNTLLDGELPIELEERSIVPMVDLQVRASVAVAKQVSVGAGIFSSTSFRLPVAPQFIVPDDWTDVQGTGWREQHRDVTFLGFSIFAGFSF